MPTKTKDRNIEADCRAFGRRLEEALAKADVSQTELARYMGVSRSAANWWAQGKTYPSIEHSKKIAAFLRTTPEYLIYGVQRTSKDRLAESIPVIDRISGKQTLVTRIAVPKEFLAHANISGTDTLRAATMFREKTIDGIQPYDIVIADTSDRKLSPSTQKAMVIDNGDTIAVGMVKRKGAKKVSITMGGENFDMPMTDKLIVGRLVASLSAVPNT